MKRSLLLLCSLVAASVLGVSSTNSFAVDATAPAEKKAEKAGADAKADKPYPYRGKVAKVDAAAKTIAINGAKGDRVITVTDATKITKDDKPATLADIPVGEEVRGQVTKKDTTETAVSVKIGAKEKAAPAAAATATPAAKTEPAKPGTDPAKPVATPAAKPAAKKP